jgi:threonine synthase
MKLYNTADKSYKVLLKEAVLSSLAPGKGLYMPCDISRMPESFFENIEKYNFKESSFEVAKNLFGNYIPEKDLQNIIDTALNFPIEITPLKDDIFSLELWHGPSLAFKDFGARFMAALMSYFVKDENKPLTILVATSGDTGGAVAFGFLGIPNIEVVILYPKGKVSLLQEKQLTTLGQNIRACEIDGNFDDCQHLVKEAFSDEELNKIYNLSSANSINIARLIPQSFYYFEAYKKLKHLNRKIVFSVPSGNFGNLTAGLLAYKMGLPIHHFIAATNDNKIVPDYLITGTYKPLPSVATISNAMDVGNPSNFIRMQEIFDHDIEKMRSMISGAYYNDEDTKEEMGYIYQTSNYISEPHGAIAHRALRNYLKSNEDCLGVFLETAHPAKFEDVVNPTLNVSAPIPERLAVLANREKSATALGKDFIDFKKYLLRSKDSK